MVASVKDRLKLRGAARPPAADLFGATTRYSDSLRARDFTIDSAYRADRPLGYERGAALVWFRFRIEDKSFRRAFRRAREIDNGAGLGYDWVKYLVPGADGLDRVMRWATTGRAETVEEIQEIEATDALAVALRRRGVAGPPAWYLAGWAVNDRDLDHLDPEALLDRLVERSTRFTVSNRVLTSDRGLTRRARFSAPRDRVSFSDAWVQVCYATSPISGGFYGARRAGPSRARIEKAAVLAEKWGCVWSLRRASGPEPIIVGPALPTPRGEPDPTPLPPFDDPIPF